MSLLYKKIFVFCNILVTFQCEQAVHPYSTCRFVFFIFICRYVKNFVNIVVKRPTVTEHFCDRPSIKK